MSRRPLLPISILKAACPQSARIVRFWRLANAALETGTGWLADVASLWPMWEKLPMKLLLILALVATAHQSRYGPSTGEITAAIRAAQEVAGPVTLRTDTIRSMRCRGFDEEPTEFHWIFMARVEDERWKRFSATVAFDRREWVLLSLG